ncbi:hypothetical protein [Chelativorans xinjiangense]|uniref:hypothetical protein n=1 Tax=Chelativorans xinjiangense TaxID=2681485 RepID=UPI0013568D8E|nr:hypothetical protein [Chelativorans xinjiangense]
MAAYGAKPVIQISQANVGIGGCEPPQPPKIKNSSELKGLLEFRFGGFARRKQ